MPSALPDFRNMTLRERMDWLEKAAKEGREVIAELSQSRLDPELKRLVKGLVKGLAEKPRDESPLSKVSIKAMPKGIVRDTSHVKLRSSSDKVVRFMLRNGDNFSDYQDADYYESPRDPAWKANAPKVAKARPDSPFKRAGRSAAKVVIVRK